MNPSDEPNEVYAPDFELPGVDKKVHHLSNYCHQFKAIAVLFISHECPYVRLYLERLKQIQADFSTKNFTIIGINANHTDKKTSEFIEEMKEFAKEHQLNFPYLRDNNQDVAHGFDAETTPEAFLLDSQGILRYRGAIDDHPPSTAEVETPYLRQGIISLLKGREIEVKKTTAVGSRLK